MTMFRMTLIAGAVLAAGAVQAADVKTINGAGATFPYPIYAKWAEAYNKDTGIKLNYQSIGSGGGIKQIKAGTVDFGRFVEAGRNCLHCRQQEDDIEAACSPDGYGDYCTVQMVGSQPGKAVKSLEQFPESLKTYG